MSHTTDQCTLPTQRPAQVSTRRRGAGLARTIILASSTLSVLVVVFAIVQSLDRTPTDKRSAPRPRFPEPNTSADPPVTTDPGDAPGMPMPGGGEIGPGRRTRLSLYDEEGTHSWAELSLEAWTPKENAPNEIEVFNPEIRLSTKSGNGVRTTARNGTLEITGDLGGQWTPRRGRLEGNVVIEIDRLTEEERRALPKGERDIKPAQVVRIETEVVEFDREYAKVVVEGPWRLVAADAEVVSSNVEIRFNESAGRVEYCRLKSAGRIVLKEAATRFGIRAPAMDSGGRKEQTIVQWLLGTLQKRLAAAPDDAVGIADQQRTAATPEEKGEAKFADASDGRHEDVLHAHASGSDNVETWRGMPVFRANTRTEPQDDPPLHYRGRFLGTVDVRQIAGGSQVSRLQADLLEILRGISDRQGEQMRKSNARSPHNKQQTAGNDSGRRDEQIVVTWNDQLEIVAVDLPEDKTELRAYVHAEGTPVQLTSPNGNANCAALDYSPDASRVELSGSDQHPASVQSSQTGSISGRYITTHEQGDEFELNVTGPGQLLRTADSWEVANASGSNSADADAGVEFDGTLRVTGRKVSATRLAASGKMVTETQRRIDRAVFQGRSVFCDGDTSLHADQMTIEFADGSNGRESNQIVRAVHGAGNVILDRAGDQVTCDRIEATMAADAEGRNVPETATAYGEVAAVQGTRRIKASDRLVVDFTAVRRPAGPFDAVAAFHAAEQRGEDPLKIDWEARRRTHDNKQVLERVVTRMRAFGTVVVDDPSQEVHITAESLDCALNDESQIRKAAVRGTPDKHAYAKLGALIVEGETVTVDLEAQNADVPGAGTMTLLSRRDLSGRQLDEPIPITITWTHDMRFRGERNQAVFNGTVHAASATTTTFDCTDGLLVDFVDVEPAPVEVDGPDWWLVSDLLAARKNSTRGGLSPGDRPLAGSFDKEPVYFLATGEAVAVTSDYDGGGALISRARIAGPKLSVDLHEEVSRMLIEGPGNLLMEDFRPMAPGSAASAAPNAGLLNLDNTSGPSKTLIEWRSSMWYDFAAGHTQFAGNVTLKHFSGEALKRRFKNAEVADVPGRSSFLECQRLTASFDSSDSRRQASRLGELSAAGLRSFEAHDAVRLHDEVLALWLNATRIAFHRDRDTLAVQGMPDRPARLIQQRPGEMPTDMRARRFYYNTKTGKIEAQNPLWDGR